MDTATTMIIMTTVTTIPAIDNPIEALPSLLACCGSSTAVLLATTVHVRRTRRQLRKSLANFDENLLDGCDTGNYGSDRDLIRVLGCGIITLQLDHGAKVVFLLIS